ncbi:unnamed protein product, partial [marine sediment metagenome]
MEFSALQWEDFNSQYIKRITDEITFKPKIKTNITVGYLG